MNLRTSWTRNMGKRSICFAAVLGGLAASACLTSSALADTVRASDWLPPLGAVYRSQNSVQYGPVRLNSMTLHSSPMQDPPPGPGMPPLVSSFFDIFTEVSLDGLGPRTSSVVAQVRVTSPQLLPPGATRFFDTEMLQLDIRGGDLPGGVMIRESPTLPSPGHTTIRDMSGGGGPYSIDSFFDVFTELSLDGGQTWTPSTLDGTQPAPMRLVGQDVPEPATLVMLAGAALLLPLIRRRRRADR